MLLGIPGDNTYSNYQEATRAFRRQTVLPLCGRLAEAIGGWLAPAFGEGDAGDGGGLQLWYDADQVEALSSERGRHARQMILRTTGICRSAATSEKLITNAAAVTNANFAVADSGAFRIATCRAQTTKKWMR
jgi:phage portal protein BeeE